MALYYNTIIYPYLGTFVTFVEVCFNVTRPAEEFVREDDIVQLDLDLTNRTLEAVLVPGQCLTTVRVHLHTSCRYQVKSSKVFLGLKVYLFP